jgi:hypothetical protein
MASEIRNLRRLQLQLELVSNKGDEFGSEEITFCVAFGKIRRLPGRKRRFVAMFMALMLFCLLSCFYYSKNRKPAQVPCVPVLISCSSLSAKQIKNA